MTAKEMKKAVAAPGKSGSVARMKMAMMKRHPKRKGK